MDKIYNLGTHKNSMWMDKICRKKIRSTLLDTCVTVKLIV